MAIQVIHSNIISSKSAYELETYFTGYLIFDDKTGYIIEVSKNLADVYQRETIIDYTDKIILPGLIDLHTHLPQYPFVSLGGNLPLLPWLNNYTFPQEIIFNNEEIAKLQSDNFFHQALSQGSTTIVAYITSDTQATDIAFQSARKFGIRAFLGKVLMDRNAPDELLEQTSSAINDCIDLIDKWHGKEDEKLNFIMTPRFAVSCSEELLQEAGKLSQEKNLFLQTHLSENDDEIKTVAQLFSKANSYTDVYQQTNCLHDKSLMGHSIHLTNEEKNLIKQNGATAVHCPTSNRFLKSGVMPLRDYLDQNIKVGLGSDIAAGYSLSMFDEMREAIESSKTFQIMNHDSADVLNVKEAFYLSTLRAAEILQIDKTTGSLEKNKSADFIVVDYKKTDPLSNSFFNLEDEKKLEQTYNQPEDILSRLIYRKHPDMIIETYINGLCRYNSRR